MFSYRLALPLLASAAFASQAHAHDHRAHAHDYAHGHEAHDHDDQHGIHAGGFSPEVSLTLDGAYKSDALAVNQREQRVALGHTELSISDSIDNLFLGQVTGVAHSHAGDTEFALEEAFIETLGLPGGLQVRAGAFCQISVISMRNIRMKMRSRSGRCCIGRFLEPTTPMTGCGLAGRRPLAR